MQELLGDMKYELAKVRGRRAIILSWQKTDSELEQMARTLGELASKQRIPALVFVRYLATSGAASALLVGELHRTTMLFAWQNPANHDYRVVHSKFFSEQEFRVGCTIKESEIKFDP